MSNLARAVLVALKKYYRDVRYHKAIFEYIYICIGGEVTAAIKVCSDYVMVNVASGNEPTEKHIKKVLEKAGVTIKDVTSY